MKPKRIRPLKGQALVELLPEEAESHGGIALPENARVKDSIGRMPACAARVLALGIWPTTSTGRMLAYEVHAGSLVLVDPAIGKNVGAELKRLKLYDHREILAAIG